MFINVSRLLAISRYVSAAVLAVAVAMPVQALAACRCCSDQGASQEVKPTSSPAASCCSAGKCSDENSSQPQRPSDSSKSCPHNCASPCCLVPLASQACTQLRGDYFSLRPIGLIFVLADQPPRTPTLDGLLRPPRA